MSDVFEVVLEHRSGAHDGVWVVDVGKDPGKVGRGSVEEIVAVADEDQGSKRRSVLQGTR
jgi:hypothetical protein